jgi:hypothetical protein
LAVEKRGWPKQTVPEDPKEKKEFEEARKLLTKRIKDTSDDEVIFDFTAEHLLDIKEADWKKRAPTWRQYLQDLKDKEEEARKQKVNHYF